jgi:outer membrane protein assembly factor BamB
MSKYALLALTGALVVVAGCAKTPPSVPTTPVADIREDRLVFFTVCTDPKGLKVQYVFDWGNGDTEPTVYHPSGETVFVARAFPDTGTFHIKVKARNEAGHTSGWSDECVFHASRPPQLLDTIVGFARWAVDRWYRPSVKVTDPDGDSVSVKFIWGDSLTSGWSPFVASGSMVTDSVKWQTTGRHVVHVLLKDKGSMVNSSAGAKSVNVAEVGLLWVIPDSEELSSIVSPLMGEIDGEPVLYVDAYDRIVCLGLDGSLKWQASAGYGAYFGPSLSNDGRRLYTADEQVGLFCIDTRTGTVLWNVAVIFESQGTPAVGPDGALYLTGYENHSDTSFIVRVRDCGDSAHIDWRVPFPVVPSSAGNGVTIGADGTIYACCATSDERRGSLVALDTTGRLLWQDSTHIGASADLYAPVIDSRGRIILGDDGGNLHCFNPDGTIAWSTYVTWDMYHGGIAVGYDDRLYFQSLDDRLYCYDSDGRQVWAQYMPDGGYGSTTPCVLSDSSVLTFNGDWGQLTCFSWEGEVLWTYCTLDSVEGLKRGHRQKDEGDDEGTPVVGPEGNVYASDMTYTYCFAIGRAHLANTAWPTYNHDNARSGWAGRPQR